MKMRDGVALASAALFACTLVLARWSREGSELDAQVARYVRAQRDPRFRAVMRGMRVVDQPAVTLGLMSAVAGGLALRGGRRVEALCVMPGAGGMMFVALLIRRVVRRARPPRHGEPRDVWRALHRYSFPSAHAGLYEVFLGFLTFLAHQELKPPASWLVMVLCTAFAALVGLARIYHNHHWPSDVVGGYLAGLLYLYGLIALYRHRDDFLDI